MSYGNQYGNNGGYGQQNRYEQPQNQYNNYSNGPAHGQNVEMQQYHNGGNNGYNQNPFEAPHESRMTNKTDLLDTCQSIDRAVDEVEMRLQQLQQLHRRVLNDQATPQQVDRENTDIMSSYRGLADRLKKVKSNPESGSPRNAAQVGRVDRRLKKAINEYQRVESDFRKQMQEQQARQYRIVRPDASEEEVRAAVEDPNTQIFQQALMNSNRTGQAQSTLSAVRARHQEIQRIEQTIVELAQLFQDLDAVVAEQEVLVENIETKGQDIQQNIFQANEQLDVGIKSARGARRKKWCCFWFAVVVIIIIVVVVVIYFVVNKKSDPAAAPVTTVTATPTPTQSKRAVAFAEATAVALPLRRAIGMLLE